MKLTNRPCEDEDYEVYIKNITTHHMKQLFIDNFGGFSPEVSEDKFFDVLMEGNVELFFLEENQNSKSYIGYVSYSPESKDATSLLIHDIHIKDEHQGKGYGNQLLGFAEYFAKEERFNQLKVFVFKNNPAHEFYRKNNFIKIKELEKNHTFVMVKKLS